MNKNKKAELTTQQIVALVILIASFIVILLFIFFIDFGKTTDAEVCHNSVVLRSGAANVPGDIVNLDCKTNYVCITEDGSCEKMNNPEKINVKSKEDVYYALAEQMRNCWWMFGEGKVEYISKDILPDHLYCSICSQISFDNSIVKIKDLSSGEIGREDFFNYLSSNKIGGSDETYADYFFGSDNIDDLKKMLDEQKVDFGSINLNKPQYVVMGVTAEISTLGYITIGGIAAGTAAFVLFSAPASWPAVVGIIAKTAVVGGSVAAGGTLGYFAGTTVQGASGNEFLVPTILEVNSEQFKALECKDVKTLS